VQIHSPIKIFSIEAMNSICVESKGALVIIDLKSGQIIGSSRYTNYNITTSSVEVGFTFLARPYWGGKTNNELKSLMLNYAFQFVDWE